jgi:signal transduction histidine kinase/putative methionine-R-sulfoxide reductase with GAF domain/HAMP domain-containing protein
MSMPIKVKMPKASRSLTVTLALAFLTLSVVVVLIAGSLQIFFNFQTQQRIIAAEQLLIAEKAANTVAGFIEEKFSMLEAAVSLGVSIQASPEEQEEVLDRLLGLEPAFRQLALLDAQGQVLVETSRLSQSASGQITDRIEDDLLAQASQGSRYTGSVYIDDMTSEPLVIMAVPVTNIFGDVQGTLMAEANLKFMWDLVDKLEIGEEGVAYVVDRQGDLIAFGDVSRVLQVENLSHLEEVGDFISNSESEDPTPRGTSSGINGTTVVTAYAPLGIPDWAVVTELPISEAYREVIRGVVISLVVMLVVGALASLMGAYMARRLATPLLGLTETATRIAGGEMGMQAAAEGPAEVISLAQAFNHMTGQLRDLIRSLEARGRELEERAREVEASQRVTFAASERATPEALLDLVVNLVRDQFHLYHVQVYMVDHEREAAVLRKSTGYAGRRLLQSGHQIPLDHTSLVTQAIHEGRPALVADVSQDANFMANPLLPHTRSELAVPLKLGDQVIGVLDAQDREPGRFSENTVALFQTMANQIAFLFENSDLLDNVAEQSEMLTIFASQLRTAADIARQLGTVLDPDRLLQQVVDMMQSRFGLYHAHIYILETSPEGNGHGPAGARLTVRAGSGEVGQVLKERGHNIPLASPKSPVARAARSREIVVINNTDLVPDFTPNPLLPQTRSELAVPLVFGEQVLGVLDMQDDQPGRFTQTELDTFTTLAGQIATALQTAGLFAQVQARFLVGQALAGTQTEDDVLNAMVEVASAYSEGRISIYTIDQDSSADNDQEMTAIMRRDESFESGILSDLPIEARFTDDQFKLLERVSAGEPFISPNLPLDERADPLSRETAVKRGIVSMALLPIMAGDEWMGLIAVSSRREGYFDERKLHLYRSLAEQGALALRTGQLFDETQQTAERLREVDRIKGEFLASMSHELRTPLNSILGYTEVMLLGLNGDLDPETQEDVQAIYDNGQHLLSLINDVLDVAKIEAGYLKLNIEELQIETLIETAQNNAAGLLTNKPGVEFVVEAEGIEAFPSIQGDQLRLTQILNNLLSNAIKFTDEGKVTLRAYRDQPDWICLEVEDSGIGIKQEDLDKIFDRFHQVDSSESRRAGGTGLGLPITRHLIELHGGTIEVRSQIGQGSTFTVRLPVQVQEDQVEPEIEAENEA